MELAQFTLIAAIAYFITSKLARRPSKNAAMLRNVSKGLGLLVVVLAGVYFYGKFLG
ncbi:MAG: hypothetical protein ABJG88_10845 [Litorimonas sp.]